MASSTTRPIARTNPNIESVSDREAEEREENKRAYQRNGHGQHRDQSCAPVLQKKIDDQEYQNNSNQQGYKLTPSCLLLRARLVKRLWRNPCLAGSAASFRPSVSDACGRLDGIWNQGMLVDGNDDGGLAIQALTML